MNFRKRVEELLATKPDECWIWEGSLVDGYGSTHFEGEQWKTHRLAYELLVGPIPEGLHIDHGCPTGPNRACFNPAHLEPVTQGENNRRKGARRTHCRYGHEWTPENTIIVPVTHGLAKWCRECGKIRSRDYMRAKHNYARHLGDRSLDKRSHCLRGHSLAGNIKVRRDGRRECATCCREANTRGSRKWRQTHRAKQQQAP